MNWNQLNQISQLEQIDLESQKQPVLIIKHSTRCSISSAALSRLERNWKDEDAKKIKPYYLDLLQHRDISNQVAAHYQLEHQSPQILIIKNGKCIYSATHFEINYNDIISLV
jgi:bacillithiol system protein YtxJ